MDRMGIGFALLIVFLKIFFTGAAVNSTSSQQSSDIQTLLDLFTKEKQNLQTYVATQEANLINRINALEQEQNATSADLIQISELLKKEKHDRQDLQKIYDQLILDFYNVSVRYDSLLRKLKDNEAKLIAVETHNSALEQKSQSLERSLHNISQIVGGLDLQADHADLLELKKKSGYHSAFTAWYPVSGPLADTIAFSQIVTNVGAQYWSSTGQFHCRIPGTYYFTMAIYKNAYTQLAYCYMRKNGVGLIFAKSTVSNQSDGSHSVVVELKSGDVIDLGSCSGVNTMAIYSSFSGFLLKAD